MADFVQDERVDAGASRSARATKLAIVAVLLACTLGARVPGALHDAFWQDEIGTIHAISEPTVRATLGRIVRGESTPPAFFLIARSVDRLESGLQPVARERALRSLSIAFSLACTGLTFVLACELLPLWAAGLAGLLVSFASILVLHGFELRAYSLLALSCVAFALVLERAAARPELRWLALLSAVVALGSLTHYFFLFTLAAGALWVLLAGRGRTVVVRLWIAGAVGLIPLVVWSPFWLRQYRNGIYATSPTYTFKRFLEFFPALFAPQAVVDGMGVPVAALVTLAVLVPSVLLLLRAKGRLCALCVLVPFLVVSVGVWVTGARVSNTRNLIGVTPFASIALAWGCAALPWRRVSYAVGLLVAALVIGGFAYGQVSLGRTPYDRIANVMIAQGFHHDEPIVWFGGYGGIFPFAWYLTTDERADSWPRMVLASPTGKACRAVEVVARIEAGRRWLDLHRSAVLAEARVPSYTDFPQSRRRPDIIVARLRWSPGILDRLPHVKGMFRLHRADTRTACLRP